MFLRSIITSNSSFLTTVLVFVAYFSALLLAMSMHEFAHAFAAQKEGDMTAKLFGRYTLAPFAHVDIKGIIFLILFGFGWGKPVPVDPRNFRNGRKSGVLVYSAGIITNILIGILFAIIYSILIVYCPSVFTMLGAYGVALKCFIEYMILLNFVFAFFNILPFYGFDGYNIIATCSGPNNGFLLFMQRYGFMLMLVLIFTGLISVYIDFVAINLANLIIDGLIQFFGLFV